MTTKKRIFHTDLEYTARESKANYVFDKYNSIFHGKVLDVGADAQYLKPKIAGLAGQYTGIGYGDNIDIEFNLENSPLPFADRSYDTVLCLDVLEHLNNLHSTFNELCRISDKYVVISLPNCWSLFFKMLLDDKLYPTPRIKWWGLPVEAPIDRHRWFFSEFEAYSFLKESAEKAGFNVLQMDSEGESMGLAGTGIKGWFRGILIKAFFRKDIAKLGLGQGTIWCVLERKNS